MARPIPFDKFCAELLMPLYEPQIRALATRREMTHIISRLQQLGVKTTADLTTGLVARLCAEQPPGQSARTLQKHLRYLRTMSNVAVANGLLRVSPFTVRPLRQWVRVGPPKPKAWTHAADVRKILDLLEADSRATDGWARWRAHRLWAITGVVALAGLRATEALTLHVVDLDLDRRIIDVTARRRLKTQDSAAPVPMPLCLVPVLRAWLAVRPDHPADFPIPPEIPWLFPNLTRLGPWLSGSPGTKPRDRLQEVAARVGVAHVTFQSLRAAWATQAEGIGYSVPTIQRVLRHSHPGTSEWYRAADAERLAKTVADFDY